VDALRRALGAGPPFHVAPHCTLVSPINVATDDLGEVHRILRAAAAATAPFTLDVGPATTFAPATPTVHLDVTGPGVAALVAVRDELRRGPLERPSVWPEYRPHVTLKEEHPAVAIPEAVRTLSGFREPWRIDRLHLLEHRRRDDGTPHWVPIREEPFGGPVVVGRGGVELALRTTRMVEGPVAALCGVAPVGPLGPPGGAVPLAIVAEPPDDPTALLGAAVGTVGTGPAAELAAVVVDEAARGSGIGRHLLAAWCSAAAAGGAELVVVDAGSSADGAAFFAAHGFSAVADRWVRRL
jgi:2'-5' RNA ligase/GNAT superfamily N-acetyltransferase